MKSLKSSIVDKELAKARLVAEKLGLNPKSLQKLGEFFFVWVLITPEMAVEWLKFNTNNRKLKDRSIAKMAQDLLSGEWQSTHEGIGFTFDPELIDGQNRLMAIIQSGIAAGFLVCIGLNKKAKQAIGQGAGRSPTDSAFFAGIKNATPIAISSSKICENGLAGNTVGMSNALSNLTLMKHKDAFDFIKENLFENGTPVRGISKAPICGAIMRAYYHYKFNRRKLSRLKKFCSILKDGQYNKVEKDVAAFRLREMAIKKNWNGSNFSLELYKITENAILHFINEAPVKILKPVRQEAFPFVREDA